MSELLTPSNLKFYNINYHLIPGGLELNLSISSFIDGSTEFLENFS